MARPKNIYRKGYMIFDLNELGQRIQEGQWVYFRGKVLHPGFIRNMTLNTVMGVLNAHGFNEAIDQRKEYDENWTKRH